MDLPIERLLQFRAITPLMVLRQFLQKNPSIGLDEAVASLLIVDESFVASDYEAALKLHEILEQDILFEDFHGDLRATLARVIVEMRPQWAKRVYLGRARFLSEIEDIDQEVHRCFREAGLFVDSPPNDVIDWWDRLTHDIRGIQNFENFMQGRTAEQMSLAVEKRKLEQLGIMLSPKWQCIEDNTLGYDILSYRPGLEFPTNLLIEVKSSSRNPPAIIVSRNEWMKAKEARPHYLFHVWDMRFDRPPVLYEWTFEMIEEHLPQDCGGGECQSVAIPLKSVLNSRR